MRSRKACSTWDIRRHFALTDGHKNWFYAIQIDLSRFFAGYICIHNQWQPSLKKTFSMYPYIYSKKINQTFFYSTIDNAVNVKIDKFWSTHLEINTFSFQNESQSWKKNMYFIYFLKNNVGVGFWKQLEAREASIFQAAWY